MTLRFTAADPPSTVKRTLPLLRVIAFADGPFSIVGTDRGIDTLALAATQRKAAAGQPATLLDAAEVAPIDAHTFPNGCHMAEVEIDPETGAIELVRYIVGMSSAKRSIR